MAAYNRQFAVSPDARQSQPTRRGEERLQAALQLQLADGASGVTRDISPTGVFFWTRRAFAEGDALRFCVEFHDYHAKRRWTMRCSGAVVRIEREGGRLGVAARIVESRLETHG